MNQACLCIRNSAKASWEIAHTSAEDEGLYECIAQSSAGQGRALTQLTVRGVWHTQTTHEHTRFLSRARMHHSHGKALKSVPDIFLSQIYGLNINLQQSVPA